MSLLTLPGAPSIGITFAEYDSINAFAVMDIMERDGSWQEMAAAVRASRFNQNPLGTMLRQGATRLIHKELSSAYGNLSLGPLKIGK